MHIKIRLLLYQCVGTENANSKKASAGSWKYMNSDRQNYDWRYKVEECAVRTQMQKYIIFCDEGHRSLIRNKIEVRSAGGMLHVNLLPL